jgi:hypothetical protein
MQNSWIHFLEVDRFVIKYNLFTTGIFINVQCSSDNNMPPTVDIPRETTTTKYSSVSSLSDNEHHNRLGGKALTNVSLPLPAISA